MTITALTETRNVFHENPIVFLLELQDAIYDGFRVTNTIPGYPSLNSILKEVRTYRTGAEDVIKTYDSDEVSVSNYDPMLFLLSVQDAVLAGFQVDKTRVSFDGPKFAHMIKAKPTAKLSLDVQDVLEEEAPKPARQTRRTKKEVTQ